MPYSNRFQHGLGCNDEAMAGAGHNLGIEALAGDTDLVTVFDDFNDTMPNVGFSDVSAADGTTNSWEENGWVMTDVGTAANDSVGMNPVGGIGFNSCIHITAGDTNDTGGNMQLDLVNSTMVGGTYTGSGTNDFTFIKRPFPHIWFPDSGTVTAADNTVYVFACRAGFLTTDAAGAWDGKVFIGLAQAVDTSIMTADTGVITIASTGPLVGFHIPEDGSIDGISHRTAATAMAEGTNFTELRAAGAVDGTTANGASAAGDIIWYDLAFRMDVTDMSETTGNGWTQFYYRAVPRLTQRPGNRVHAVPGQNPPWVRHSTVLTDQTPNDASIMVPTIEVINGATETEDTELFLDWWAFGISRYSRQARQA
jgi:hypothetical protein